MTLKVAMGAGTKNILLDLNRREASVIFLLRSDYVRQLLVSGGRTWVSGWLPWM